MRRAAFTAAAVAAAGWPLVRLAVKGQLTLDTRVGRRTRPLGPLSLTVTAPPATVFDVIAGPYLGRTPRALTSEVTVLERGSDLVLAEHHTTVGTRLTATTVETVRFTHPDTIDFRLLRGPVPHVVERFTLHDNGDTTRFDYKGELGTDFWGPGRWWGNQVAHRWEAAVHQSMQRIKEEAERRASSAR
jgi:Polyketide cyclase / dehydrase and lipid transport